MMNPTEYAQIELLELRNRGYIMAQGQSALDVGCGGGEFVRVLRNMGWDAIGIDLQVERNAELGIYPARFLEGDLPRELMKEYDFISFRESFYYMNDVETTFWTLVKRLLKPDGFLYIKTHVRSSYWHMTHTRQSRKRRLGSITLLPTARELSEMLRNEGFHLRISEPYPWNDLPTNSLFRRFVAKLGFADRYWFLATQLS
jgi:SAM-dependent methyltransferase